MINPQDDGTTHINAYSKGETLLGRRLSNWAYLPFSDQEFGDFDSIEGLWYFLKCQDHPRADELRHVSGYAAKALGRELSADSVPFPIEYRKVIRRALIHKINTMPGLLEAVRDNKLPYEHYYVYGGVARVPVTETWFIDMVREVCAQFCA